MTKTVNKLATSIFWSYLQSWLARGLTITNFFILGFYIGPNEFGVFAIISAFLAFCDILCEQAFSQIIVQLDDANKRSISYIFFTAITLGLVASFLLYSLADTMSVYFKSPDLKLLLQIASICPSLIGLTVIPIGLAKRAHDFKLLTHRTVLASIISTIIGLSLIIKGCGVLSLVIQSIFYYSVGLFVLWRNFRFTPSMPNISHTKFIMHSYLANLSTKTLDFIETRGVELLIGGFLGVAALGIFSFANKVVQTAFQLLISPLLEAIFPKISENKRLNIPILQTIQDSQLIISSIPICVMMGIVFSANSMINYIYGNKWVQAIAPIAYLTIAFVIRSYLYIFGSTLLALNALLFANLIAFVRATLTILFVLIALIYYKSVVVISMTYILTSVILIPVSTYLIMKETNSTMTDLLKLPAKVFTSCVIAYLSYYFLNNLVGDNLFLQVLVALLCSVLFLFLVIAFNVGLIDRRLSNSHLPSKIKFTLLHVTKLIISLRGHINILRFTSLFQLATLLPSFNKVNNVKSDVIVPADTSDIDGSLGDQALLLGLGTLIDLSNSSIVVNRKFKKSKIFANAKFLKIWDSFFAGWYIGRFANHANALYIVGADVMDGYYSPFTTLQRLILVDKFARLSIPVTILGFSFNETPNNAVIEKFSMLPESVRICLRDPVSKIRFEKLTKRKTDLVADLAFLVQEVPNSIVALDIEEWANQQKQQDRFVFGININPQVISHLDNVSNKLIAVAIAKTCEKLISDSVSILLIPHDFRTGCADRIIMDLVFNYLGENLAYVKLIKDYFTAQEIKSACKSIDLLFSARMHLAIGALSVGTPVCGMQYQGKFEGLFKHFDFSEELFIDPVDALNEERLYAFLINHIKNNQLLKTKILSTLPNVKLLSQRNVIL